MIALKLSEIKEITGGQLIGNENIIIDKLETDSRKNVCDSLFVALKGEKFDAHDYINQVVDKGCKAIVVNRKFDVEIPQIIVDDTLKALGLIGLLNRTKSKARIVGITGTCGKTSVKEMTASILKTMGNIIYTQGNFNNAIGVPLTLLQINEDTEYAVVEMGANHPHEIEYSVNLVRPEAVVINNVGSAHLEGFGSLNGVYKAKSEILDYVFSNNGKGIVNMDNEFYSNWVNDYGKYALSSFSIKNTADCYATDIKRLEEGCFSFVLNLAKESSVINLNIPGYHNVSNSLAAALLSSKVGAKMENITKGLSTLTPTKGRLFVEKFGKITLIDDAYNASVNAVKSSIDTLSLFPHKRIFIFGDMGELGENSIELHREIGKFAKGKIDELLTVGKLAKYTSEEFGGTHFENKDDLYKYLDTLLKTEKLLSIIAKGSHSMKMHEVVEYIQKYEDILC
ncbi:MAG: UDP-N-acetylmuramoyl-tripeptide--D-alanyl-D-alanine ligase [Succinivibrionaceae bacterium]